MPADTFVSHGYKCILYQFVSSVAKSECCDCSYVQQMQSKNCLTICVQAGSSLATLARPGQGQLMHANVCVLMLHVHLAVACSTHTHTHTLAVAKQPLALLVQPSLSAARS